MARRRRVRWRPGDLFGVMLPDGQYCLGQALGLMGDFKNVVNCAFFNIRFAEGDETPSLALDKLIAVVSTTRDLLDAGYWLVVGNEPLTINKKDWPNEQYAANGYVGAKTYGSGIIKKFLAAYYGHFPWNCYKDPEYFDKLLLLPSKKPPIAKLKFKDTRNDSNAR